MARKYFTSRGSRRRDDPGHILAFLFSFYTASLSTENRCFEQQTMRLDTKHPSCSNHVFDSYSLLLKTQIFSLFFSALLGGGKKRSVDSEAPGTSTLDTNTNSPHKSKHATEYKHLKWGRGWWGAGPEASLRWIIIFIFICIACLPDMTYYFTTSTIPPPPAPSETHTQNIKNKNKKKRNQTRENVYLLHILEGFV